MLPLSYTYHVEVILKELGVTGYETETYSKASKNCEDVIDEIQNMLNIWILKSQKKKKTLPTMY